MTEARTKWLELFQALPKWHKVLEQELREKVLLQAIKDAAILDLPGNIRSDLHRVQFFLETHQGLYAKGSDDPT